MRKIAYAIILLITITSCVEKYWSNIDKYEYALVVDGFLTNGSEPALVQLSFSSQINMQELIPAIGAELTITSETQLEIPFVETEPGIYKASDTSFHGEIGSSYQLHIKLPNGKSYESDFCTMPHTSSLDSVYGKEENQKSFNSNEMLNGIQFYVDNHTTIPNDTIYYLWRLTQTIKYRASFTLDYTYSGEFIPFPNPDSLRTCWLTTPVSQIFIFSTKLYGNSVIRNFPINYVSTESKALSIRYSLLVKQLSISKDAFDYYNTLKQQNIEQGDFYSEQPIQIRGNIVNVANPEEAVLGYFTVASVTEKRVFVNRPHLPFIFFECKRDYDLRWIRWSQYTWPLYLTENELGKALGPRPSCFDCREEGGKLTPPDFWE